MRSVNFRFLASVWGAVRKLGKDQTGVSAVIVALSATVIFGFAGLAIDAASWEVAQLSMQGVADAAAYSAALAYSKGASFSQAQVQAQGVAAQQGYSGSCSSTVSGTTVSVCVNQPPSTTNDCTGNSNNTYSGTGSATAIQVVICQPQPRFLSGFLLSSNPTAQASAVSAMAGGSGSACILALSSTASPGITISGGNTNIDTACDIVSDSTVTTSQGAINISGGATVTTPCLVSVGVASISASNLDLTKCSSATNHATPVADPFASVAQPAQPSTAGSCSGGSSNTTCTPGYYSQGLNVNATVTFQAGLYYFGKNFQVSGGTATGTDVVFFIDTGQTAAVSGNASVSFTAPTSSNCITSTCPYVGLVFFGSRNSNNGNNNFSGGSSSSINGAIYFPTQEVTFSGGSTHYNACTQLVASTITVSGQSQVNLSNSCNSVLSGDTFADGSTGSVQLVE